jgi:DNA repair protein RadA/Sms
MPKTATTIYACTNCDAQFPKWMGQCGECGNWGTIAATQAPRRAKPAANIAIHAIPRITDVQNARASHIPTSMTEFDSTVGGGIVEGALLLIGGEPGIGKSTLVLQIAAAACKRGSVLYVTGEETASQLRGRAERLHALRKELRVLPSDDANRAIAAIEKMKPSLAVIDSVQTLTLANVPGGAGGVSQVRAIASSLLECAKRTNVPIIAIGHVTKDGSVAGPKTLEHLVDQVALLEGDPGEDLRILRMTKNRFGATDAVGVFRMDATGFTSYPNPEAAFLSDVANNIPGRAVAVTTLGNRVMLVEIQALVTKSAFGQPQRRSLGIDSNRLHLLLAVLAQHGGMGLAGSDIHVATIGGVRLDDPGADLAIAAALASAAAGRPLPFDAYIGEIGLDGSIRGARSLQKRISEAQRLGRKNPASKKTLSTIRELTTLLSPKA